MSTLTPSPSFSPADKDIRLLHITVDQYHRMIEAGAFAQNNRVELLEGLLVEKMSKNPPHAAASTLLSQKLMELLPPG